MIIIINGCPSSGKSSIAKELQKLHNKPLLHTGIDHLWKMIPDAYKEFGAKAHEGYAFVKTMDHENRPIIDIQMGAFAQHMDHTMPHLIKCLADCGHDIVVDEVFVGDEVMHYAQVLHDHNVYFVGVVCELQELERREKMRGNRELGLARGQIDSVHKYINYCDIVIDSTSDDVATCAQKIMDFIQSNPDPQGMKKLLTHF